MQNKAAVETKVSTEEFIEKLTLLNQQFSGFELRKASLEIELALNDVNFSARIYTA